MIEGIRFNFLKKLSSGTIDTDITSNTSRQHVYHPTDNQPVRYAQISERACASLSRPEESTARYIVELDKIKGFVFGSPTYTQRTAQSQRLYYLGR